MRIKFHLPGAIEQNVAPYQCRCRQLAGGRGEERGRRGEERGGEREERGGEGRRGEERGGEERRGEERRGEERGGEGEGIRHAVEIHQQLIILHT